MDSKAQGKRESVYIHTIAGGLAGLIAQVATQPFDVVKTKMIGKNVHATTESIKEIVLNLHKQEGVKGFYRGTVPAIWRVVPGAAINFSMVHSLSKVFKHGNPTQELSNIQNFIVGGISRGTASILLTPINVVKTRFEFAAVTTGSGVLPTLVTIYRTEGLSALFSGAQAGLYRDIPYSGLYYLFYSKSKKLLHPNTETRPSTPTLICSAAIGGVLASMITHPFDVIRTRVQLQHDLYSGVINAFNTIRKEEGTKTLFRGLLPRMCKRSMSAAVSWTLYEKVVQGLLGDLTATKPKLDVKI